MSGTRSFGAAITLATKAVGGSTQINTSPTAVDFIDITAHDSPDGFREFIGGLKDGGNVSLTFNYIKTDVGQLELIGNPGKTGACVITLSDGTTIAGNVVYGGVSFANPLDNKIECSAELKWSGEPTITAGA